MAFIWDEDKRLKNLAKHGLDFIDAEHVFENPYLEKLDTRHNYGEDRWVTLGMIAPNIVVLIYTERGEDTRIISLRKATSQERRIYEKAIANRQ